MSNIKMEFAASAALTITLNSLASGSARESTVIDNGTNKYLDALITIMLAIGAGTIGAEKCANIYAYGSEDGTNFTDNATGSDAAITLNDPTNLKPVGMIAMPTQSLTYKGVFNIAQVFGGVLPRKWGIVVKNNCGIALAASGNSASYSGIYATSV